MNFAPCPSPGSVKTGLLLKRDSVFWSAFGDFSLPFSWARCSCWRTYLFSSPATSVLSSVSSYFFSSITFLLLLLCVFFFSSFVSSYSCFSITFLLLLLLCNILLLILCNHPFASFVSSYCCSSLTLLPSLLRIPSRSHFWASYFTCFASFAVTFLLLFCNFLPVLCNLLLLVLCNFLVPVLLLVLLWGITTTIQQKADDNWWIDELHWTTDRGEDGFKLSTFTWQIHKDETQRIYLHLVLSFSGATAGEQGECWPRDPDGLCRACAHLCDNSQAGP